MLFSNVLKNSYHKIIVLTIKEKKSPGEIEQIKTLYRELDNEKLFSICKENEVDSIVAANFLDIGLTQMPNYWMNSYRATVSTISNYFSEVSKIGEQLKRNGIPIVALKNGGICLGLMRDFGKCPMGDIDTLVHKKNFMNAHEILLEHGYTFEFRSELEDEELLQAYRDGSTEYFKVLDDGTKMWFELAWRAVSGRWIRPDQEPDTDKIMDASIEVQDSSIRMLVPEDNLLQVALHTAKHSYVRAPGFRLHLDVERIVKHSEIDWNKFLCKVKETNVCVPVYFSLYIPKLLFNTPVPDFVLKELEPGKLRKFIILKWLETIHLMYPRKKKFSNLGFIIFTMMLYDSFGGLVRAIIPEKRWIKERYGIDSNLLIPVAIMGRIKDLVLRRSL